MKKYLPIVIIGGLVLVGAVFFSSWQKRAAERVIEKSIEKAIKSSGGGVADVDIDRSGDEYEVTYETEEGSLKISSKGELPKDFPNSIPVYPGAKVVGTVIIDELRGGSVSLTSDKDPMDVTSYYRKELENNGYDITSFFESEGTSIISAKNSSLNVGVAVVLDDEIGTMIQISYSPLDEAQ